MNSKAYILFSVIEGGSTKGHFVDSICLVLNWNLVVQPCQLCEWTIRFGYCM